MVALCRIDPGLAGAVGSRVKDDGRAKALLPALETRARSA
jgi:hypothetical protein